MTYYLVDYENTSIKGVTGIEQLVSEDRLIIFYGPKTGSVPFEDLVKITATRAALEFIRTTKTAKNYLDFQLTTYLGYLVSKQDADEYVIISGDSGFDAVVDFWTEKGLVVQRFKNLAREVAEAKEPVKRTSRKTAASQSGAAAAGKSSSGKRGRTAKSEQPQNTESVTAEGTNDPGVESGAGKEGAGKKENRSRGRKKTAAGNTLQNNGQNNGQSGGQNSGQNNGQSSGQNNGQNNVPKNTQRKTQKNSQKNTANASQSAPSSGGETPAIPEAVKKKIRAAFKEEGLRPGAYRKLYACMLESPDKAAFNTALVHAFTQEIGNKYYKLALPAFSGWEK